jgi:hypothetical protein
VREPDAAQRWLRGEPVLADQAAEQITPPAETIQIDDVRRWLLVARRQLAERRPTARTSWISRL